MFLQPYQAVCLFKTEIRWTNGIKNMQDMYIHEVDFLIVNFPLQENDDEIFIIELYNTLQLTVNLMTKNHCYQTSYLKLRQSFKIKLLNVNYFNFLIALVFSW